MNIENIKTEITNKLGSDFQIYYNTTRDVIESNAADDKAVGIFRVSAGDIQPLTGIQGLTAQCSIDLFIPTLSMDKFMSRIDKMIADSNGVIKDIDLTPYRYVCGFSVPVPQGVTDIENGVSRQVFKIDFSVVVTAVALFGNDAVFIVNNELLVGVTGWDVLDVNELLPNLIVNNFASRSIAQLNTYKLSLTLLVQNNFVHIALQQAAANQSNTTFLVEAQINGITKSFEAIVERFNLVGLKGEFQVANIIFAEVI